MSLTEEEKSAYRDCFTLYDRDGDGKINVSDLGILVRSLGRSPTDDRIKNVASATCRNQAFTFDDLCKVMTKLKEDPELGEEDVKEAFKVFDRENNNAIHAAEMKHILTNLGEKLSEEEAEELIKFVDVDQSGQFIYEDLVAKMSK